MKEGNLKLSRIKRDVIIDNIKELGEIRGKQNRKKEAILGLHACQWTGSKKKQKKTNIFQMIEKPPIL